MIADFGDVRPFSNIVESERRHIDAVVRVLRRYHVAVPPNTWPDRVPRFMARESDDVDARFVTT